MGYSCQFCRNEGRIDPFRIGKCHVQNATIVIVPSSAVETMGLGSMAGLTALTMGIGQDKLKKESEIVK